VFKSSSAFSLHIEELAATLKITHMDAVLHYCEENFIEPDDIKTLINKTLKDKIENDMIEANMLPRRATLEIS
jgi:hypothetical protein